MLGAFALGATALGSAPGSYAPGGGGIPGDTTGPVMVGPITVTRTSSSLAWAWPVTSDAAEYRYSLDGGAEVSTTARTLLTSGLPPLDAHTLTVTAYDSSGNPALTPLTLTASTLAEGATPDPDPAPELPDPTPPVTAASRSLTWLRAAVVKWTHRGGLEDVIDDFIMLAEKRIRGDLEARLQNAVVSIDTIARLNAVLLPHDVAEIRSLTIPGYEPLAYISPDQLSDQFAGAGQPTKYTVIGSYIYLSATPDAVYSMQCACRQMVPSLLDAAGGENWLIRDHPEIYLSAVMCEALNYIEQLGKLPVWEGKYKTAIDGINKTDWHTGGAMRVRSDVNH